MTNQQLYLAIGIPLLFNAALIGLLTAMMNAKFSALEARFEARITALEAKFEARFSAIEARLDTIEQRFDDMRDLWRAELRRVEEVLDTRLKQLESR